MKPVPFLLLALILSPAIARADLVYKCKTQLSGEKTASLRFEESGRGGSIEVEYWNGYPPLSLVNAELRPPTKEDGKIAFQSEVDSLWGYSSQLKVPEDFLRMDFFEAEITLFRAQKKDKISFLCNRF